MGFTRPGNAALSIPISGIAESNASQWKGGKVLNTGKYLIVLIPNNNSLFYTHVNNLDDCLVVFLKKQFG